MVTPEIAARTIEERSRDGRPLRVFWVTVAADRDDFAASVAGLLEGQAAVPIVLRTGGFVNPDSVMRDVAELLDGSRSDLLKARDAAIRQGGVDVVVVSRKELSLTNTSSPILLPDWFPVSPGHTTAVSIDDLTWTAAVAVSDRSLTLDDLRRILYDLDRALVARLTDTLRRDRRRAQAFWDLTQGEDGRGARMTEELARMEDILGEIRNPTDYRPSAGKGHTMIGRLWAHTNRTSPDRLGRTANALAHALDLGDAGNQDMSLAAVLGRPTNPIGDRRVRWAFCLTITVRSACQLVTAAAHADEYPRFAVSLLKSTSLDMRRFLDAAVTRLETAGWGES